MGKKSKRRVGTKKGDPRTRTRTTPSETNGDGEGSSFEDRLASGKCDLSYLGRGLVDFLLGGGQLTRDQMSRIDTDKCSHDELAIVAWSMRSWPVTLTVPGEQPVDLSTHEGPGSPRTVQTYFGSLPEDADGGAAKE